jgi:3',5'-cyclic AMP phosphodiesterase CpdA
VRFIHLTDLHVAARNDLLAWEVNSTVNLGPGGGELRCLNFNDRLREFINAANALADANELDFVLALGDLVDFVNYGISKAEPGDSNWNTLIAILTGSPDEAQRGNPGLRVPIYATTGNHDWRPFTYPPEFNASIFGLKKRDLEKFDYLYAESAEVVGKRIAEVYSKLVSAGSPILARSWWGTALGKGLGWLGLVWDRSSTRILALGKKTLLGTGGLSVGVVLGIVQWLFPGAPYHLLLGLTHRLAKLQKVEIVAAIVFAFVILQLSRGWINGKLRDKILALIAIETDVNGLHDYFLELNPYFNYAFRLENCYFLVLDTGYDALTAESFWDDGGKKIQHLRVRDNIIGGSPESMGFFTPNEYYAYSQISWLEAVLDCIHRTHDQLSGTTRKCRIIVGLHAPPANISTSDRNRADRQRGAQGDAILLRKKWPWGLDVVRGRARGFDIHYGTLNHYVSEFFYLCLGFRQSAQQTPTGPGVDIVLAGHVHWNLDLRLARPAAPSLAQAWDPEVYYGDFSQEVEHHRGKPNDWWGPLLLQTAACGPRSTTDSHNPYFRYITIDQALAVPTLGPRTLPYSPMALRATSLSPTADDAASSARGNNPPNV